MPRIPTNIPWREALRALMCVLWTNLLILIVALVAVIVAGG